jgi:light-regulated signal transduction histidine kinase (bacteriophytochrome)
MNALVAQACESLLDETRDRQVAWVLHELPPAQADPALIRQVLVNLIGNAIKYTCRTPQALIEVGCRLESGLPVYFVRDNGAGFDMRYVDKLFRVFQRLHHQDEYEGTGIGLATVARIVNRHGGRVWAEAAIGQGATFYFALPG